jgi:hypothetical protein
LQRELIDNGIETQGYSSTAESVLGGPATRARPAPQGARPSVDASQLSGRTSRARDEERRVLTAIDHHAQIGLASAHIGSTGKARSAASNKPRRCAVDSNTAARPWHVLPSARANYHAPELIRTAGTGSEVHIPCHGEHLVDAPERHYFDVPFSAVRETGCCHRVSCHAHSNIPQTGSRFPGNDNVQRFVHVLG